MCHVNISSSILYLDRGSYNASQRPLPRQVSLFQSQFALFVHCDGHGYIDMHVLPDQKPKIGQKFLYVAYPSVPDKVI
jgi:hypothetical protein